MGPFWKHFSEDVGGYGRHGGTIFLVTVLVGAGLLVTVCILHEVLGNYFLIAIGGGALIVFSAVWATTRQARRNRGRYIIQPLAREEIRRARSKLLGNQNTRKL